MISPNLINFVVLRLSSPEIAPEYKAAVANALYFMLLDGIITTISTVTIKYLEMLRDKATELVQPDPLASDFFTTYFAGMIIELG